jgi:hypothetical protein
MITQRVDRIRSYHEAMTMSATPGLTQQPAAELRRIDQ